MAADTSCQFLAEQETADASASGLTMRIVNMRKYNRKPKKGESLAEKNPDLAAQWHPVMNGELTPYDVTCGSDRKIWWIYPYDDPETGMHYDFEWEAKICKRSGGAGCPFLTGNAVWAGFNDLETKRPDIAKEWHPTRNIDLTPRDVTCRSEKKVWWLLSYDDPETGKHFDFEWKATISNRTRGRGCPYLSKTRPKVWPGFNDLETKRPDVAKEWHPQKNGTLTPSNFTCNSRKKAWWLLSYDDPETGKHFNFEWESTIYNRVNGNGCPFLTGKKVYVGFNDLASRNPYIAEEWHPIKNRGLRPEQVPYKTNKKAWWLCRICGREYRTRVSHRTCYGSGCNCIKK